MNNHELYEQIKRNPNWISTASFWLWNTFQGESSLARNGYFLLLIQHSSLTIRSNVRNGSCFQKLISRWWNRFPIPPVVEHCVVLWHIINHVSERQRMEEQSNDRRTKERIKESGNGVCKLSVNESGIGYQSRNRKHENGFKGYLHVWFCFNLTVSRRHCCRHSLVGCKWMTREPIAWYTNIFEQSVLGNWYVVASPSPLSLPSSSSPVTSNAINRSISMPACFGTVCGVGNNVRTMRAGVIRLMRHRLWLDLRPTLPLLFNITSNNWSKFTTFGSVERTLYASSRKISRFRRYNW